jgi:hypothetical protein
MNNKRKMKKNVDEMSEGGLYNSTEIQVSMPALPYHVTSSAILVIH